jgi:hypothetical protein
MIEDAKNSCSPYLVKERRELAVACRQISEARGEAAPPCAACTLRDMCRPQPTAELIPLPRPRTAARDDFGGVRAA